MRRTLVTVIFEIETADPNPGNVVETILENGAAAQSYSFEEISVKEEAMGVEAAYKMEKS